MNIKKKYEIFKLLKDSNKRIKFYCKGSKEVFWSYHDLVHNIVRDVDYKGLNDHKVALNTHIFLLSYDGTLLDALYIYWDTGNDYFGFEEENENERK